MKIKSLIIISAVVVLSGCAFTVHDLPVNYQFSGDEITLDNENLPEIMIDQITDSRDVENPRMIMHLQNGYGQTTSGGWQAEKELALIIKDALTQGVEKSGLNERGGRQISIDGQLVDVASTVVSGWSKGTINVKVSVKLTARDKDGKILWRDTIYGDAASDKVSMVKDGLAQAFSSALDSLVANFIKDEYFQQQVLQ